MNHQGMVTMTEDGFPFAKIMTNSNGENSMKFADLLAKRFKGRLAFIAAQRESLPIGEFAQQAFIDKSISIDDKIAPCLRELNSLAIEAGFFSDDMVVQINWGEQMFLTRMNIKEDGSSDIIDRERESQFEKTYFNPIYCGLDAAGIADETIELRYSKDKPVCDILVHKTEIYESISNGEKE